MKAFLQRNWIHFVAVAAMFILCLIYFSPLMDGYGVKQHDLEQWQGMANETLYNRDKTGEHSLWTNSMFGGMPVIQITMLYAGNLLQNIQKGYYAFMSWPLGLVFLHMLSFYLMGLLLRIRPLIALMGAVAFSFASYEIIIIQAGHNAKAMATAYLPLLLGTFVHAYRNRSWLSVVLASLIMTLEIACNHLQVTYYMVILLVLVGIYFFVEAIKNKSFGSFLKMTGGLLAAYILAALINSPNVVLTNDYAKNTIRGKNEVTIAPNGEPADNQSKGLDRDYITQWSYGIGETFTLISPNVKGGGSFAIGGSPFEEIADNMEDFSSDQIRNVKNMPAYWGDQPFTSGPVYIGVIVALLAFIGLVCLKDNIKWPLFAVTILAIMLSWGKNYMGFTNFFIDHFPGYDKFRTVTMILVLVELTIPFLGVLFLNKLIENKEAFKSKGYLVLISGGVFIASLLLIKVIGLGDGYTSDSDARQLAGARQGIENQIMSMDPAQLLQAYQLDVTNSAQLNQFVDMQMKQYEDGFNDVKEVRKEIFKKSMNRSIGFSIVAFLLIVAWMFYTVPPMVVTGGMLLLVMIDVIPVANQYLGKQEEGSGYKYWMEQGEIDYPFAASPADEQIMQMELAANPELSKVIDQGEKAAKEKAESKNIEGAGRQNLIDSYRFAELNLATNYRVFNMNGGFNSSNSSYFHKSLGGYHGAKLRNIANVMDFHIAKGNNKVFDMMNVKYIIKNKENNEPFADVNPGAAGNAWMVKSVEEYETANDEIRALGIRFKVKNIGVGELLVNGKKVTEASVYGGEDLTYAVNGKDAMTVPLSNGVTEGMEINFVMDRNGKTDLVLPQIFDNDTARSSFLKLVSITAENDFKVKDEAVMMKEWANKLSQKQFTAEGTVKMKKYQPNKISYDVDAKGKQLVVFSEVFYPEGWTATIDGKPVDILKANYLLRAIEVPDGNHVVEMAFDLPKYHLFNKVSLIGTILLFVALIAVIYYNRKKKKTEVTEA